jgi:hypothetical protein
VPTDVPPGLAAFYPNYLGAFLKSELALDPVVLATNFEKPILVINGGSDTQVLATRDAARYAPALSSRNDGSEVFTPPRVSHNLKTVADIDDEEITGTMDTRVKETIVRWLKAAI